MGIFVCCIISFIIGCIILKFADKYIDNDVVVVLGSLFVAVGIVGSLVSGIIASSTNTDYFKKQYSEVQEELEVYHHSDIIAGYNYLSELDDRMTSINKKIISNKKHANTFWLGWFYDEEIGNYKVFDIKKELEK